jgi:ELWxxDGT repeat protein
MSIKGKFPKCKSPFTKWIIALAISLPGADVAYCATLPEVVTLGTKAYVPGTSFYEGCELWKTDGTPTGTTLFKDICPGTISSSPQNLTETAGGFYFSADDGVNGRELWFSDGTANGTKMVKNIAAGTASSNPVRLIMVGGVLFFSAYQPSIGTALWKSDGTASGTQLVKDINESPPVNDFDNSWHSTFCAVGNTLFFNAMDPTHGRTLWKSDGTSQGTVRIKNVTEWQPGGDPVAMAALNGKLYFTSRAGSGNVWVSDGTDSGTKLFLALSSSDFTTAIGNYLYIRGSTGLMNNGIWRCDENPNNLSLLTTEFAAPGFFVPMGNSVYSNPDVIPDIGHAHRPLCVLSEVPPRIVAEVNFNTPKVVGNIMYFGSNDGQLWKTNGTTSGTIPVTNKIPSAIPIGQVNAKVLASTGNNNPQENVLWSTDGTDIGTRQLLPWGKITVNGPLGVVTSAEVVVSGLARAPSGITQVEYSMSGATTGSGFATGTNEWSFPITLNLGVTNIIITAHPVSGPDVSGGVNLTYSLPAAAAITITEPTIGEVWTTAVNRVGITGRVTHPVPFVSLSSLKYTLTGATSGFEWLQTSTTWHFNTPILNTGETIVTVTAQFGGETVTDSLKIIYSPEPLPPLIEEGSSLSVSMSEDSVPMPFSLTLHAMDPNGDTLTWTVDLPASHGTVLMSGTGSTMSIGYIPTANYIGNDSFVLRVEDPFGQSDTITVNVIITPSDAPDNSTPVATDCGIFIRDGILASGTLQARDADSDQLIFSLVTQPQYGSVALDFTTGNYSYTPFEKPFLGLDSFAFQASDGRAVSNVATAIVQGDLFNLIQPMPTPAVISGAYVQVSSNFIDIGGMVDPSVTSMTWGFYNSPGGGPITEISNGIWHLGMTITHGNFLVTATSANGHSVTRAYDVWYTPSANSAPVIAEGASTLVNMSYGGSPVAFDLTLHASDTDGDALTWAISSAAFNGTASATGAGTSKSITYVPNDSFIGHDHFVVRVSDGRGGIDSILVKVNITSPPIVPGPSINEGSSIAVVLDEDGAPSPFAFSLHGDHQYPASLVWSISFPPGHGVASANSPGSTSIVSYIPTSNYNGGDTFVVRVVDIFGQSDAITVNATVNPRNDPPVCTVAPSVSGDMFPNEVLTAASGTWSDAIDLAPGTLSFAHQWQVADNGTGANLTDIAGATEGSYSVSPTLVGKFLRVKITATDNGEGLPASATAIAFSQYGLVDLPDVTPLSTLQFSQVAYSANEDAGTATISVTRLGDSQGAIGVTYSTASGSASPGSDYTTVSNALSWAGGDNAPKTFTVSIIPDSFAENPETVLLALSAPTGGAGLGDPANAILTINSDDRGVRFGAASYSVSENSGMARIDVIRIGPSSGSVRVSYRTRAGSAATDIDFKKVRGDLRWDAGDMATKFISVPIRNDLTVQASQSFTVELIDPSANATLGSPSITTVDIQDSEWAWGDTGPIGAPGQQSSDAGAITVLGSGSGIGGIADSFHFVYQAMTGDATIVARVASVQNVDPAALAGVMMRESLAADSRIAFIGLTPKSGIKFKCRVNTATAMFSTGKDDILPPRWLKLAREGSQFRAYHSSDGATWTKLGSTQTIPMSTAIYVGLAVTSDFVNKTCAAKFRDVSIDPPTAIVGDVKPGLLMPSGSG